MLWHSPNADTPHSSGSRALLRRSARQRRCSWHDDRFGGFDLDAFDLLTPTSAAYDFVECRAHVLDQVEPIRYLYGVGRTPSGAIGIRTTAIANDHFNTRMRLQPVDQWFGITEDLAQVSLHASPGVKRRVCIGSARVSCSTWG